MGEVVPTTLPREPPTSGAFLLPMTYAEQLQDPRWKQKRQEIIDLNLGYCTVCGTSKNIQVHHKKYIDGRMAWEYTKSNLTTLCSDCHKLEHDLVNVSAPKHINSAIIQFIDSLKG